MNLLILSAALAATPQKHVRIVLDISGSMNTHDPDRLAPVATMLLYDLVWPEAINQDSFSVIPFNPAADWSWTPGGAPPSAAGTPIIWQGSREPFSQALEAISYNGKNTLYFPGIQQAIQDFRTLPTGGVQQRVLVLVTDGLPEQEEEEITYFRRQIGPDLRALDIDLYVLAFGGAYQSPFFDRLLAPLSDGIPLGAVMSDPDGSGLMTRMITLFEQSFGYSSTPYERAGDRGYTVDLENGESPDRVAAVAWHCQHTPPILSFQNTSLNVGYQALANHRDGRCSYGMQWLMRPSPGLAIAQTPATDLVVLRPRAWYIRDQSRVRSVVAERPTEMAFEVLPRAGRGAIQDVRFQFVRHAEADSGNPEGPLNNQGNRTANGQEFRIRPTWPDRDGRVYEGRLEVFAYSQQGIHTAPITQDAFQLRIYPDLRLQPEDESGNPFVVMSEPGQAALQNGDRICRNFRLKPVKTFPILPEPRLPLRIWLAPSTNAGVGVLRDVTVTLDDHLLRHSDMRGPGRAARPEAEHNWYDGRSMSQEEILAVHRLCIEVSGVHQGGTIKFPLYIEMNQPPYNSYPDMIPPLEIQLTLREPSLLQRFGACLGLSILSLLGLLTAWLGRFTPDLPPDMEVEVEEGGIPRRTPISASEGWRRLFGLRSMYPLSTPQDQLLGQLCPLRQHEKQLFIFLPLGAVVEGEESKDGSYVLESGRSYILHVQNRSLRLRISYRTDDAGIA